MKRKSGISGPAILILLGFIIMLAGIMWSGSVGMAYQDLNSSTQANTTAHAATDIGEIYASGYVIIFYIIGTLLMLSGVLIIILNMAHIGGR